MIKNRLRNIKGKRKREMSTQQDDMTFSSLSEKLHMPRFLVKRAGWWKLWRSDSESSGSLFKMVFRRLMISDIELHVIRQYDCATASHTSCLLTLNFTWVSFTRQRGPLFSTVIRGYVFKLLFMTIISQLFHRIC